MRPGLDERPVSKPGLHLIILNEREGPGSEKKVVVTARHPSKGFTLHCTIQKSFDNDFNVNTFLVLEDNTELPFSFFWGVLGLTTESVPQGSSKLEPSEWDQILDRELRCSSC